jgi:hypothetical protein
LGKSFGALTGAEPPLFLRYIDTAVLSWMLKGTRPLIFSLLERLPIKSLREFLASGDGVYEVGFRTISMVFSRFAGLALLSVTHISYVIFLREESIPGGALASDNDCFLSPTVHPICKCHR